MKEYLTWFIIGLYCYGWFKMFFGREYLDDNGLPITKKQWKRLMQHEILYH